MTELFLCLDPVIVSFLFVLLVYTWKPKILFEIFELLFLIIIIRLDNHQCVPLFPFACPSTVCLSEIRFCIIDFKHGLKLALSNYGKIFSFKFLSLTVSLLPSILGQKGRTVVCIACLGVLIPFSWSTWEHLNTKDSQIHY